MTLVDWLGLTGLLTLAALVLLAGADLFWTNSDAQRRLDELLEWLGQHDDHDPWRPA